jgi:anti-sigma B factor antagonist
VLLPFALQLEGELDAASVPQVEKHLFEVLPDLPEEGVVQVDCARLTFIDSTGLAMLIRLSERVQERLQLVNVPTQVARVFSITALAGRFGIAQSHFAE